ncbi:Pentatricopeptide repeat-containing protein At4g11690 [Hondaea fermentalgiana]|uniref:Pentatricopeptide repeat-containing protein At4g11690 n=1 Tax=Hondaea fermentalgiana TaxID=2315210 RepID=A0A2R5G5E6_9STRA|nr:Pentatricopeptide repeat-containing protein At4g11690 [Hondaea fermentalgiana]|eukprot:GBG25569.1 Pentatricopeptide repeat-containing protein At4g11690 [Hondaea fermentalgiana]
MATAEARRRLIARVEHVEAELQAWLDGEKVLSPKRQSRAPRRLSVVLHEASVARSESDLAHIEESEDSVEPLGSNYRVDNAVWRLITDREDEVAEIVALGKSEDAKLQEKLQAMEDSELVMDPDDAKERWKASAQQQRVRDGQFGMALRNAKFEAQDVMPQWVRRLNDAVFLLDHFGFEAWTWWRPRFMAEIDAVAKTLCQDERSSPAVQEVLHGLDQCKLDINICTARQLIERVHKLLRVAEDIDNQWGAKMRAHRELHSEWMATRQNYRKELQGLSRRRVEKVGTQGPRLGFYKASRLPLEPLPAKGSPQMRRLAAASVILFDLDKVEQIPVTQLTEREIHVEYLLLLAACADQGLWHISITIYRSMWVKLQSKVGLDTYRLIITACKHATPSNSAQAIQVLAELRRRGFRPSVAIFNAIIDACVQGAEWRASARLVRVMAHLNVPASAVTYDTLFRVCAGAPLDHSPMIYETLKLAGVPETIAFGCARANLALS